MILRRGGLTHTGVGLAACSLLAIGVLTGAVITSMTVKAAPREISEPRDQVVSVTVAEVDDSRLVPLNVTMTEFDPLRINTMGTVTAVACRPGRTLNSGDVLGAIDGKPLRLLATSVPPWRDLRRGDRGPDVSAVQVELRRLGFDVADTGRADTATALAVRQWLADGDTQLWARLTGGDTSLVLPLEAVVWSPKVAVTPITCGLRLGAAMAAGDAALTPAPEISQVTIDGYVSVLPGRSRTLTIGSVTVPVEEGGTVTADDALRALVSTPEFTAWLLATDENRRLEGTLALDSPVLAASVPPAAVVGAASDQPCLIGADGSVTPVVVVSSQLGLTLVTPSRVGDRLPSQVVIDRTGRRVCESN